MEGAQPGNRDYGRTDDVTPSGYGQSATPATVTARDDEPPIPQPVPPREPWASPAEIRGAATTIAALIVVGALAGVGWAMWSHTPTRGLVYTAHSIIPDQTEGFISSDGRFAILTSIIGLTAGLLAWSRRGLRGPWLVAGLGVGSVLGALVTDLVGRLLGGGTDHGRVDTLVARLPLEVHATGCLFVEGVLAVGLYTLCVLVVAPDDLARGAPADTQSQPQPQPQPQPLPGPADPSS